MTTKNSNPPPTDPGIYIAALSASFKPAAGAGQATHWFTTDEVYEAIHRIDPGSSLTREQVHHAMLEAGYRYHNRPGSSGLDFRWMLTAK